MSIQKKKEKLIQWSLQNRAHRAADPVGVETGPVGKPTTGHKCARLEFWVAHPKISVCPPHNGQLSSFPAGAAAAGVDRRALSRLVAARRWSILSFQSFKFHTS